MEDILLAQAVEAIQVAAALGMEVAAPEGTTVWILASRLEADESVVRAFASREEAEEARAAAIEDVWSRAAKYDDGIDFDTPDWADELWRIIKLVVGGAAQPLF